MVPSYAGQTQGHPSLPAHEKFSVVSSQQIAKQISAKVNIFSHDFNVISITHMFLLLKSMFFYCQKTFVLLLLFLLLKNMCFIVIVFIINSPKGPIYSIIGLVIDFNVFPISHMFLLLPCPKAPLYPIIGLVIDFNLFPITRIFLLLSCPKAHIYSIIGLVIQRPRLRSPLLFPNLGDAGCVCYISCNRVPHFQSWKTSHASIIPKLCIRIEHCVGIAMSLIPFRNSLMVGF